MLENSRQVGNGEEVNARGSHRVIAGQNVAGQDCQRERLIAVAEEIARGQLILFVERVVDLSDQAVDVIQCAGGHKQIRRARVVKQRQRTIRCGPGIPRQQTGNHGIRRARQERRFRADQERGPLN